MERFRKGFTKPTIIRQLRAVLDQYPDDGQILKELIQNAEDAGAKEIKFLYEETNYGTSSLTSAEMASFQGPALYAYNDAMFTEQDWDSVRMLQGSVKEKDPLKVGRFGLGFKSVYHMTDLPSIFSDALIGYLDPHASFVQKGEETPCWNIVDNIEDIKENHDQFRPFQQELFGVHAETFAKGRYPHTLFRFPFRTQASDLSQLIYSREKISSLFHSLEAEAHQILLFLKNLKKVELYERRNGGQPQLLFRVESIFDSLEECCQQRNKFFQQIKDKHQQSCHFSVRMTTKTTKFVNGAETQTNSMSWVVSHYYGCQDHQVRQISEDLGYLPWVAVAFCVDPLVSRNPPQGHLFSFLPLPREGKSPTGLAFHVHGYFALEQNRRHLKWPTADQNRCNLTDRALVWNLHLVNVLLPEAMMQQFHYLTSQGFSPDVVYSFIPDIEQVQYNWKDVLDPYFSNFFGQTVCHTTNNGGLWVTLNDALAEDPCMDTNLRMNVRDMLTSSAVGKNIVVLPTHMKRALTHYKKNLNCVTPTVVCWALHVNQMWHSFSHKDKLLLLEYITRDTDYRALQGLQLLPLANGVMETFSSPYTANKIFMDSDAHPRSLLPGVCNLFVDNTIGTELWSNLQNLASHGSTQLVCLREGHLPELLHKVFPQRWRGQDTIQWSDVAESHLTEQWFKQIWQYLGHWFPSDLSQFEQFHLIIAQPKQSFLTRFFTSSSSFLIKLSASVPIILRSKDDWSLTNNIASALMKFGVQVLDDVPQFILQHQAKDKYILMPSPSGIQKAVLQVGKSKGLHDIQQITKEHVDPNERRELRQILGKNISDTESKRFFQNIPFFDTSEHSCNGRRPVCIVDVTMGIEEFTLPIPLPVDVLDLTDSNDREVAKIMGAMVLNTTQQLTQLVFPAIREGPGHKYSKDQILMIMLNVLQNITKKNLHSGSVMNEVKTLKFVPIASGELYRPSDCVDPSQELLTDLFEGQDVFPVGKFRERHILEALQSVGLQTLWDIGAKQVVTIANELDRSHELNDQVMKKSSALMKLLRQRPSLLDGTYERYKVSAKLAHMRWMIPELTKPSAYPCKLPWAGALCTFQKPVDLKSVKFASVCGSVNMMAQDGYPAELADAFGWNQPPNMCDVVAHLGKIVQTYSPEEKPLYMGIIVKVYQQLSTQDSEHVLAAVAAEGLQQWIWHGDGFVAPDAVVFQQPLMDFKPHIYSLPPELKAHRLFLSRIGVKSECNLVDVLEKINNFHEMGNQGSTSFSAVAKDLQLSIDILNDMANRVKTSDESLDNLLIPLYTEEPCLRMARLEFCTYCEDEWLRDGKALSDLQEEEDILPVHPNVPAQTAKLLNIPTLMSRILDAEELDISYGQSEPLTRRIKNILDEYKDGFAVLKELVQNADDAGATEVKILYDERQNEGARTCLIAEGMEACQGPALWAYNNALFSEEDFENLVKLSGATKDKQTAKIGRFGLGFSAVYNLTDVPSFVSGKFVVIFDPHQTHLGNAILNKNRPGIKLNIQKRRFARVKNQFKPYNGVFGCDLAPPTLEKSYPGTLFRFPLRTVAQAQKSEISQKHYDRGEVLDLLKTFEGNCQSVLLFTQHVLKLIIYHLPVGATDPTQAVELISVQKTPLQFIKELHPTAPASAPVQVLPWDQKKLVEQCSILREASQAMALKSQFPESIGSSFSIKMETVKSSDLSLLLPQAQATTTEDQWLIHSSMGIRQSYDMAVKCDNLVPVGGIALKLKNKGNYLIPDPVGIPGRPEGQMYCFLPLPIPTFLPVHLNGYIAVTSNRRHLCEKTTDDKDEPRAAWNEALMEDTVCSAYLQALEDVKTLSNNHAFKCMELWPQSPPQGPLMKKLFTTFYQNMTDLDGPPLFSDCIRWKAFKDTLFLDAQILRSSVGKIALKVAQQLFEGAGQIVVDLPQVIVERIKEAGYQGRLERNTCTQQKFFGLFLSRLGEISTSDVDELVQYALLLDNSDIDGLLKNVECIPTAPDGKVCRKPSHLIHPRGEAFKLYSVDDNRFPLGYASPGSTHVPLTRANYNEVRLMTALERLGMVRNKLPWDEVVDRAKSVKFLPNEIAMTRSKYLVEYLNFKLRHDEETGSTMMYTSQEELKQIEFLPIKPKPENFPLSWKGDSFPEGSLLSPAELYLESDCNLVSCTGPVAQSKVLKPSMTNVVAFLGMTQRATIQQSVCQLEMVVEYMSSQSIYVSKYSPIHAIIEDIYMFLEKKCEESSDVIYHLLKGRKCLWVEGMFFDAASCAFKMPVNGHPYLCTVPSDYVRKYRKFLEAVGVQQEMNYKDYQRALAVMKKKFGDQPLSSPELSMVVRFIQAMCEKLKGSSDDVENWLGTDTLYIPDVDGILTQKEDLCFNNCPWLDLDDSKAFTHGLIAFDVAQQLGIKTNREEELDRHSEGIAFGQSEKLTNRLRRIMQGYPGGKEILKELVQNADDAGATEIHFIMDSRNHPGERIFEDKWKPLQGPALCVYNNKPFTHKDLDGIKNLGQGSKGDDPCKTGQYGIGFNCVYHLTDTPTFLTSGSEVGQVLCALDPHCRYVPGAKPTSPGRLYTNIDRLKVKFPDVFPGYLEELFSNRDSTMFRLPLRTNEQESWGELGAAAVSLDNLKYMLEKFQGEVKSLFLFLNHIEKIVISKVDDDGNLKTVYSASANLLTDCKVKRNEYLNAVREIGKQLAAPPFDWEMIENKSVVYTMKIGDSEETEENWAISRTIGISGNCGLTPNLKQALKCKDLALLPRGGIAAQLSNKIGSSHKDKGDLQSHVYCFLPLPIQTELPVHVNGHFALDSESRRHLWKDEGGGYRTDWNNLIMKDVVSRAYLAFLKWRKEKVSGTCKNTDVSVNLQEYHEFFPKSDLGDAYLNEMSKYLYKAIANEKLLAVPSCDGQRLEWYSASCDDNMWVFFNNLPTHLKENQEDIRLGTCQHTNKKYRKECDFEPHQVLAEVLHKLNFKLLLCPLRFYGHFMNSGVHVKLITPEAVLDFMQSPTPTQQMKRLPQDIRHTPYGDVESFHIMWQYCAQAKDFIKRLVGSPLLLAADKKLYKFETKEPKFLTKHSGLLLPSCGEQFAHCLLWDELFKAEKELFALGLLKNMDIQAFADLLPNHVPDLQGTDYLLWNPSKNREKEQWIFQVWSFLKSCAQEAINHDLVPADEQQWKNVWDLLKPVEEWCLLPANKGKAMYLVPLGRASTVLDLKSSSGWLTFSTLADILRKLQVPEPIYHVISRDRTSLGKTISNAVLARLLVGNTRRADTTLIAIQECMRSTNLKNRLNHNEGEKLLKYFSDSLEEQEHAILEVPHCISILSSLPFFTTVGKQQIALHGCTVYVVPTGTPTEDMDVFNKTSGNVFLYSGTTLDRLYTFLGCTNLTTVELYDQFVFLQDQFEQMTVKGRLAHLKYIKKWVSTTASELEELKQHSYKNKKKKALSEERKRKERELDRELKVILRRLKELQFIPSEDGSLKKANEFMDPYNQVFKAMHPKNCFPPEPFLSDWIDFLKMCGLQYDITEEMFVRYATQVETEAQINPGKELKQKYRELVNHLFQRKDLITSCLLEKIVDIKFLAPEEIDANLLRLHNPFTQKSHRNGPFHCYRGSVVNKGNNMKLSWTSANLISPDALCGIRIYDDLNQKKLLVRLQVLKAVPISKVVENLKTVCNQQNYLQHQKGYIDKELEITLDDVLQTSFIFLKGNMPNEAISKENLGQLPCVLVEKNRRLVCPSQLVIQLKPIEEIPKYLYRLPGSFGKFENFLCHIGTTEEPTIEQYAWVLGCIYQESKDQKMEVNEMEAVSKAVCGILVLLETGSSADGLHSLYLPSEEKTLKESSELVFIDDPAFRKRLHSLHACISILDSRLFENISMIRLEMAMRKLPPYLQPQRLSSIVSEKLEENGMEVDWPKVAVQLQNRFTSEEFRGGITRLLKHVLLQQSTKGDGQDILEKKVAKLERNLDKIQVMGVSRIITYLEYNGERLKDSEDEKPFFYQKDDSGTQWKIYISRKRKTSSFWPKVKNFLNDITGHVFQKNLDDLLMILECPLNEIDATLDDMSIKRDFSEGIHKTSWCPVLGSFIPIDEHHLLQQDFEYFRPGEYVGFEICDDLHDGEPSFVYCKVVHEVANGQENICEKLYMIQVDNEGTIKKVSAMEIYKFHRKSVLVKPLLTDGEEEHGEDDVHSNDKYVDISKMKDSVTSTLESTWGLSCEDKRKVHKRLILAWHPDKNPGHESFAKEVFQHLQNELRRLERDGIAKPSESSSHSNTGSSNSSGSPYWGSHASEEEYWEYMNDRARVHQCQRKEYQQNFKRSQKKRRKFYNGVPPSFSKNNPQPSQARRWLRQAKANLEAAPADQTQASYEWACCKLYQATEAGLVAARFAMNANHKNRTLLQLATGLGNDRLSELTCSLESILKVEDNSCISLCRPSNRESSIPHEKYTYSQTEQAREIALEVLKHAKNFIQERWHNVGDL